MMLSNLSPQDRVSERIVEQVVDEEIVEVIQLSPPELISERIVEQVVDVQLPQFPASVAGSTSVFLRLVVWRHAVQSSPSRSRFPRWALIKWLLPASFAKLLHARAQQISRRSKRQEKEPEASEAPKLDEVRSTGVEGTATQRSPGQAFVHDVHRTSVFGKSPKGSQSLDSSLARTRLLHLPLRQKEGQVLAPAWQVLPPS